MHKFFYIIISVLLVSGCQTPLSSGTMGISPTADISVVKGSKSHLIEIEVDQSLRSMLSNVYFYNITEAGKQYILVSGSIKKQMGGASIDRKKVNVRFVNDKGEVLAEGTDKILISRMRRPIGSKGKFSMKIPYNSQIKKCIISFLINPR